MNPEQTADAGDTPSSSWTIARYRGPILRYLQRLSGNRADAEDLTQETFLRAHRQLGGLRDPAALEGWLYRIATNVCYERFRSAEFKHRAVSLDQTARDGGEAAPLPDETSLRPDQLLERHGMSECVQDFLAALPETYRTVLLLHDLHGLTDPEIAAQSGLTPRNVKIRLHRARLRLKAALEKGCEFSHNDRGVFVCTPKPARP